MFDTNKTLFNIAADLVVNQYIAKTQLPTGGIVLENFDYLQPMYGITLERDKDVGYYYRQLDKTMKQKPQMSFEAAVDKLGPAGKDGSSQLRIKDLLDGENEALQRHKFWEEFEKMNEGERKIAEYQANRIIKQTAERVKHKYRNYGNLPAGLAEKLAEILKDMEPKFNWRRVLRLFAASSNSSYIKNTIRRPSRRYGTVPGIKIKRRNKLLVAIDTSGSIRQDELLEFFSEIYFIWRQGAEIQIVECDTHIHKTYNYKGTPPVEVHGRGGTSFDAPMIYGNQEYRPDALIYFTDGYAPAPQNLPRFPVLWIISSNGIKTEDKIWDELPGKKLKIA